MNRECVMANPFFRFKQFTVWHDRCAMKVGTDAVLLGSWVNVDGAKRLLDIGCGCGLIALMVAQRCKGHVVAVEIDSDASSQAAENVSRSPWSERVEVINADIRTIVDDEKFDVIFSNPPYFVESLKCPDKKRSDARHTDSLSFDDLMRSVSSLLKQTGEFSVVIPASAFEAMNASAVSHKLYLTRHTWVFTKKNTLAKRVLLTYSPKMPVSQVAPHDLVIEKSPKVYSDEFAGMVKDFYL